MLNACGMNKGKEISPIHNISSGRAIGESVTGGAIVNQSIAEQSYYKDDIKTDTTETKSKFTTIIDETGNKSTLKLDKRNINFDDISVSPSMSWFGDVVWSQVYKNHYYYAYLSKNDHDDEYTIYKDYGEKVGSFIVDYSKYNLAYSNYTIALCIYKDIFYIIIEGSFLTGLIEHTGSTMIVRQIGTIDFTQKKPVIIHNVFNFSNHSVASGWTNVNLKSCMPYTFYHNEIYFKSIDTLSIIRMKERSEKKEICNYKKLGKNMDGHLFFMDNKIYYGIEKGKTVKLYCYNLNKNSRQMILEYNRKDKSKNIIDIEIDNMYIYSQEYIIPLNGGKMVKKPVQYLYGNAFVHNEKYIFYLDRNYKLHKVDKKNLQKDKVISKEKFFSVDCTEKELYLRKYEKKWYENRGYKSILGNYAEGDEKYNFNPEDADSDDIVDEEMDIYIMNFDGTDLRKIWKIK